MQFLLLLLQLLLDRLIPAWRDGLTMAARADGRVEHHPMRPTWWDCLVEWFSSDADSPPRPEKKVRALRGSQAPPADTPPPPRGAAPDLS